MAVHDLTQIRVNHVGKKKKKKKKKGFMAGPRSNANQGSTHVVTESEKLSSIPAINWRFRVSPSRGKHQAFGAKNIGSFWVSRPVEKIMDSGAELQAEIEVLGGSKSWQFQVYAKKKKGEGSHLRKFVRESIDNNPL